MKRATLPTQEQTPPHEPRKGYGIPPVDRKKLRCEYVGKLRKFKEKAHVQSAHECIRPTSLVKKPPLGDNLKLFELILGRTLASLSTPALLKNTKVMLIPLTEGLSLEFVAKGRTLIFDGWTKFEEHDFREEKLPKLEKGQVLKPQKIILEERQTEPPKRYTEGSLVKKLENLGIGRPSTYATIIKTLKRERLRGSRKGLPKAHRDRLLGA
jgi:DNA topoisomerase-1